MYKTGNNKEKIMTNDWELEHVGIVVKDIAEAVSYYQRLGLKQSSHAELLTREVKIDDIENRTPAKNSIAYKSCCVENQTVRIEFIQPLTAGNPFSDRLAQRGEGLNILVFRVDDLMKEKEKLAGQGIPVIGGLKNANGNWWKIYFDTRKYGNVIFALLGKNAPYPFFRPVDGPWKYHHLGLIVGDCDKLYEYYQLIGLKPLSPPREMVFAKLQGWLIYGRMPALPQKTKACQFQNKSGTFLLEVNQPDADGSLHREFLEKSGDGINHIHFLVDDLEKELADMESRGFPAIYTSRRPDGKLMDAFFETRKIGNTCISLWGGPPPFKTKPE
jgi:catechol 2,3-dioxygenase-like lactoylglutathione lyase family enzyme